MPSLVLSLDFELRWGVHDSQGSDIDGYRANLEGVQEVVPRLLDLFVDRGVRATWATVGALGCEDWTDYFRQAPRTPRYADRRLCFDPRWADRDPDGVQHFAPRLVEQIAATRGQEIGSHTFGHIFFREPGVMRNDVRVDTTAARSILARLAGYPPRSLVYPRNQMGFGQTLTEAGIDVVRTTARGWSWQRTESIRQSSLVRGLRLLSTFRPHAARPVVDGALRALPASAFVRLNLPEPAFKQSVKALAERARQLRGDETLHLWLHPHNFGDDPAGRTARFARVIDEVVLAAPRDTQWRALRDFAAA